MAARGARAAIHNAGDRVPPPLIARRGLPRACIPPRLKRRGLHRWREGLVTSLARPGGNLTGVNFFSVELAAKRLELLREVAPTANRIAVLVNRANSANTDIVLRDLETATGGGALQIRVLHASTSGEIDVAFASLARERVDAIYVGSGPPFSARPVQVALQGARSGLPAIYLSRNFAEAGGLMSYGASLADAYRQAGIYAGRILKGAKPAD